MAVGDIITSDGKTLTIEDLRKIAVGRKAHIEQFEGSRRMGGSKEPFRYNVTSRPAIPGSKLQAGPRSR